DRGLPPGTAPGITAGLIGYLPSLLDSLGLDGSAFFKHPHGRFEPRLGSAAAVVDLSGALLRDTASRALLLTAIPVLAVGADRGLFELDSVNNYVITLVEAAATGQIEEEIHAARTRADWNSAIGVMSKTLKTAWAVGGKQGTLARDVANVVDSGARRLVDRIAVEELDMDDVHITAFLLLTYGVSIAFLNRRRNGSDDDPRIAEAVELTDEIERLLDGGGSAEDGEREIRNLRMLVGEISGDDAMTTLDDLRLAPNRYTAAEDAELSD
ncbi:MAG: hypothetical protein P8O03_11670, partial [Ilumatobacter sp.]|nr:hypothetical protein [Ilumatobacter sp.]